MTDKFFAEALAAELQAEAAASTKCLERFKMDLFDYKPHEKSMIMGYLALLIAEIPSWISYMIDGPEVDIATIDHLEPKSAADLVRHLKENVDKAVQSLNRVREGDLSEDFSLKVNGETVFKASKKDHLESTVNHLVHHRGQLTVYMRLNDIPVPSIYGPSADDRNWDRD